MAGAAAWAALLLLGAGARAARLPENERHAHGSGGEASALAEFPFASVSLPLAFAAKVPASGGGARLGGPGALLPGSEATPLTAVAGVRGALMEDDEPEEGRKRAARRGGSGNTKGRAIGESEESELHRPLPWMAENFVTKTAFLKDLPSAWAEHVDCVALYCTQSSMTRSVYATRLLEDPAVPMAIEIAAAGALPTRRAIEVVKRLKRSEKRGEISGGNIISVWDTHVASDWTYSLYEGDGTTMGDRFAGPWHRFLRPVQSKAAPQGFTVAMPLTMSVPFMIDLLQGAKDLETAGVIHGHISPEHVAVVGGSRAVISGLRAACLDTASRRLGRPSLNDSSPEGFALSAFWQAPEARDGVPLDASNHVWGIGMIFATMCFGANPAERFVSGTWPKDIPSLFAASGRRDVRRLLAKHFNITEVPNFRLLDEDLQEVLQGMLDKDPQSRWTTEQALQHVEALARRREEDGVRVPMPRIPPQLPSEWLPTLDPDEEERKPRRSLWHLRSAAPLPALISSGFVSDGAVLDDGDDSEVWQ